MSYSQKDVTNGVKGKKRKPMETEDLMDEIDEAFKDLRQENQDAVVEEEKEEKDLTESIDTEIMDKIKDEFEEDLKSFQEDRPTREKEIVYKSPISVPLIILIITSILCAVAYFIAVIINKNSSIYQIISCSLLSVFSIIYLVVCLTSTRRREFPIYISSILLIGFFLLNMNVPNNTTTVSVNQMQDFSGKTLTEVVRWGNKNNIKIIQDYEYSDIVPEYEVISQDVKVGTNIHDIDEVTVAISEGPNPFKEVIVPSMLTWDSERVIHFVLSNYMSNVLVDFVESDQVKDTVIEQSKSGNLRRNDELRLVFSYGDEGNTNEVTLIDFTDMTKFEIEFYLKQHKLNYDFVYDFSDTIKKDHGVKQSVKAGTVVAVNGDKIQVTISRGPKIEIPDLSGMSVDDLTEWAIDNRLKLEFVDKYDDTVKKGKVISVDKEKGEVVEQGTLLKVTLSLGSLKMPKFKNIDAFYTWADKFGIKYEVRHEFSDSVPAGEIIEFSYKTGTVLKNDDAIVVTISDGAKVSVPKLLGFSKSEATKKLKNAGLNYNFVYKNNSASKDTVIGQSISAGSEVSSGTTVTVTLSNGNGGSSGGGNTNPNPSPSPSPSPSTNPDPPTPPTPSCNDCMIPSAGLKDVISQKVKAGAGYKATADAVIGYIEGLCPGINVQVRSVPDSGLTPGKVVPGYDSFSGGNTTSCSTVYLWLAG